ncbi:hypothetical protein UT300003_13720 [Clostridium sardiniense]
MFLEVFVYIYDTMKIVNIFIINPTSGLKPDKKDITNKKELNPVSSITLYNGYKVKSNFKNDIQLRAIISPIEAL